jgi:hypothetical protein
MVHFLEKNITGDYANIGYGGGQEGFKLFFIEPFFMLD